MNKKGKVLAAVIVIILVVVAACVFGYVSGRQPDDTTEPVSYTHLDPNDLIFVRQLIRLGVSAVQIIGGAVQDDGVDRFQVEHFVPASKAAGVGVVYRQLGHRADAAVLHQ